MPNRKPTAHGSRDLLLVFGVAAFMLGTTMVSQGVPPAPLAARPAPPPQAVLKRDEPTTPARGERSAAATPPAARSLPRPTGCATLASNPFGAACTRRNDRDRDQLLALLDMAMWQRGFARDRSIGPYRYYGYFAVHRPEALATVTDGGA